MLGLESKLEKVAVRKELGLCGEGFRGLTVASPTRGPLSPTQLVERAISLGSCEPLKP